MLGYGRCDSDTTPAGTDTTNAPRPNLGSVTYTDDIYDCVQSNVVALTYDDGPYLYTAQLLDTLKSYGFTATFFVTGNNNGKGEIDTTAPYPDLIQRMVAEGHQVASHTWSHYSLSNSSSALRISQMVKNEMAFNNIIGKWYVVRNNLQDAHMLMIVKAYLHATTLFSVLTGIWMLG